MRPVDEVGCGRATHASGVGTPVLRRSGNVADLVRGLVHDGFRGT